MTPVLKSAAKSVEQYVQFLAKPKQQKQHHHHHFYSCYRYCTTPAEKTNPPAAPPTSPSFAPISKRFASPNPASLGAELVGREGHALRGPHLKLGRADLRVEAAHEGHGLAGPPAVSQVQRSGEEQRAHGVDHAFQHHQEHGSGGLLLRGLELAHLVPVGLQPTGLLCRGMGGEQTRTSQETKYQAIGTQFMLLSAENKFSQQIMSSQQMWS